MRDFEAHKNFAADKFASNTAFGAEKEETKEPLAAAKGRHCKECNLNFSNKKAFLKHKKSQEHQENVFLLEQCQQNEIDDNIIDELEESQSRLVKDVK